MPVPSSQEIARNHRMLTGMSLALEFITRDQNPIELFQRASSLFWFKATRKARNDPVREQKRLTFIRYLKRNCQKPEIKQTANSLSERQLVKGDSPMFKAIESYINTHKLDAVHMSFSREGDKLRVVTTPFTRDEARGGILTPLTLAASVEELEAGYGMALSSFKEGQTTLEEQVQASLEEARAAASAATKPVNAKKPSAPTSKVAPTKPEPPLQVVKPPEPKGLFGPPVEDQDQLEESDEASDLEQPDAEATQTSAIQSPTPSVQPTAPAASTNTVPFSPPQRSRQMIQAELDALIPRIDQMAKDFMGKSGVENGSLNKVLESSVLGTQYLALKTELEALEKDAA